MKSSKSSLSAIAYDRLRQAIHSGKYGPGDRLVEEEIAERLKISRTPVREALQRLENEGLLVHEAHTGLTVVQLDYHMVMELHAMREVLEGAAAAMAARNASDIELLMLADLLENREEACGSAEAMAEHNRCFHQALYQCAHNRYLLRTSSVVAAAMAVLSKTAFSSPERRLEAWAEHCAIADAIRARNPELASQAAQDHLRAAQVIRLRILGKSAR